MKLLNLFFLIVMLSLSTAAQNRSSIIGDWYIKEFEDYENGLSYVSSFDFNAKVTFSKGGRFIGTRLCNGIGGGYKLEGNKLTLIQSGFYTKVGCSGANNAIENAFKTFGQELTLETDGSVFYIISPGKFKMLLSRFQ